jgi:hypothetical protein
MTLCEWLYWLAAMYKMIHLVAGESVLRTLRETAIPGDKFSVDDILMEGPVPDGLRSESSWTARADYLERHFSISGSQYLAGKAVRDRLLRESWDYDETVLWFEFDLFCQANLLYLLDWYAEGEWGPMLSLVCPEKVPGRVVFHGLGELHVHELESLFANRSEVTDLQKAAAQNAWHAYGRTDPRAIENFLLTDSGELPLVAPALRSHLERFPSKANGLGILGQKTLEILAQQPLDFHSLFRRVRETPEIFRHGIGDLQLQAYLDMWASGPSPLIQKNGIVEITATGRSVIENSSDAIQLNGIDLWYGGVHMTRENHWRWDTRQKKMYRARFDEVEDESELPG